MDARGIEQGSQASVENQALTVVQYGYGDWPGGSPGPILAREIRTLPDSRKGYTALQKVYLDTCTLNRPLDDKGQLRVALEAEAVLGILSRIEEGALSLVGSEVLTLEVQRTAQPERKVFVQAALENAAEFIPLDEAVQKPGEELEKRGFRAFDALHLACAEASGADFFCTCDDRVLKKAGKQKDLHVRVVSPLQLAEEVSS